MEVRCRVEGWPLPSPMSETECTALVQVAEEAVRRLPWSGEVPVAFYDLNRDVIVVEGTFTTGSGLRRALRRLVGVAMVLSLTRPLWLWTIRDDADAFAADLGVTDLVAWRGIFGRHPYPSPAWSAVDVTKDQLFDHRVRWALGESLGAEVEVLGVRIPPPPMAGGAAAGEAAARLLLFDYQPEAGWRTPGVDALVVLGRSMVQVDGRRRDGRHRVTGRVEVHNPSAMDLTGARVQLRLCDAQGTLLAVVEGALAELPAGSSRLVTAAGEVRLGGHPVVTVDIGCEAQLSRAVGFRARVVRERGA